MNQAMQTTVLVGFQISDLAFLMMKATSQFFGVFFLRHESLHALAC
jgi:hypothetical protein